MNLLAGFLARAGGGQGFGGGGGGGGLGGGGGGGASFGGGGGHFLFFGGGTSTGGSIFGAVVVVAVVLFVVASIVRRGSGPGWGRGGSREVVSHPYSAPAGPAYEPGTVPVVESGRPVASSPAPGIDAIKGHDPDFNVEAFKAAVERSFFVVEEGWTSCKPEMTRRVMADGIWQQHRTQIEHYQANGTRNVLDGLAIGRVDVVSAASDAQFDTITCRILATCADYDVEVSTGKVVRGDKHEMTPFQEDWVFQRSSRATTKPAGGTMDEKCPNCGAPLDLDLSGVCHYCRAPVMSGDYDWVLTRIDQV